MPSSISRAIPFCYGKFPVGFRESHRGIFHAAVLEEEKWEIGHWMLRNSHKNKSNAWTLNDLTATLPTTCMVSKAKDDASPYRRNFELCTISDPSSLLSPENISFPLIR